MNYPEHDMEAGFGPGTIFHTPTLSVGESRTCPRCGWTVTIRGAADSFEAVTFLVNRLVEHSKEEHPE